MATELLNEYAAQDRCGLEAQLALRMALRLRARGLDTDRIAAPDALLSLTAFRSTVSRTWEYPGKIVPECAASSVAPVSEPILR